MKRLKKLYKDNIYGVIGTLAFHILLIGSFLLSEVKLKGEVREEPVVIEFAQDQEKEETPEVTEKEKQSRQNGEDINTPSNDAMKKNEGRKGFVADQPSSKDPFFDKEYQKEIADAQKLVTDVNKQLSKKIPDMKEFEMPEETTEGMDPKAIKNTIYSGESNIHYFLDKRYHVRLPIPVYLAQGGGKVTVDIWVTPDGKVIKAEVRDSPQIKDPMLPVYAKQAALRTVFNEDLSAPNPQKGTIIYTFVPQ